MRDTAPMLLMTAQRLARADSLKLARRVSYCTPLLVGALCTTAVADSISFPSNPVVGRPPVIADLRIENLSVPGDDFRTGDTLHGTYIYSDVDADPEQDTVLQWQRGGVDIPGATSRTYTTQAADENQELALQVRPRSAMPADPEFGAQEVSPSVIVQGINPPVASNVTQGGTFTVGETLSGNYRFDDPDGDAEGASTYAWIRGAENDPNAVYISGATARSYILQPTDEGQIIRFEVTPVAQTGRLSTGVAVAAPDSPPIAARLGAAPVASNVTVTGTRREGETLTADYTYSDADGDAQGATVLQWWRGGGPPAVAIPGATGRTYVLQAADVGQIVRAFVTPVAQTGLPKTGAQVKSADGAVVVGLPRATDVTIEKPTATRASFQANYTYSGEGTEQGTTYQWFWKGQAVSGATQRTFAFDSLTIPSSSATEELAVEVRPRSAQGTIGSMTRGTLGLRSSIGWNAPLSRRTWFDVAKTCAAQSNANKRPGTQAELQGLVNALGNLGAYGVDVSYNYWTGTSNSFNTHQVVGMKPGSAVYTGTNTNALDGGICVAGSVPGGGTWPAAFGRMDVNGHRFGAGQFNPTNGFVNASFVMYDLSGGRTDITYRTTDSSVASLDSGSGAAKVTLLRKGRVDLEVYSVQGGNPAIWTINPVRWWHQNWRQAWDNTPNECKPQWGVFQDGHARINGRLWGEWGPMQNFGWVAGQDDRFHTAEPQIQASLFNGNIENNSGNGSTVRYLACYE